MKALLKRLKLIIANGASRLITVFSSVIISLFVVRMQSPALWGDVVVYTLIIDTGFSIVSWGASPFLLRGFSLEPKHISTLWNQSFSSRIILIPLFVLIIFLMPFGFTEKIWLCVWILSRYIYQSFEPVIQFHQDFIFSAAVEMAGLLIVVLPIVFGQQLNSRGMIVLLSSSILFRAVVTAIVYRKSFVQPDFSWRYFGESFPFLLLTFSAMIQQRADLYSVATFMNRADIARYQIFVNLLIFAQFAASLLLSPFAKNIFRVREKTFLKLERSFVLAGIWLSGISILAQYLITKWVYGFEYSWLMFALGYFYILAFYFYLLRNYLLGKQNKQIRAAAYGVMCCGVNFVLCYLFIPMFGLEGALGAGLIAQVVLVVLYQQNKFNDAHS